MTKRSVTHDTFTLERTYDAPPARVFAAWTQADIKARWFRGPEEWKSKHTIDFRIGGSETSSGGPPGGPVHHYRARYYDIVPNERVVSAYDMHMDDAPMSVSLATVEFHRAGKGTRLVYTEQGAFLDGQDFAAQRSEGTQTLLDKLGAELAHQGAE